MPRLRSAHVTSLFPILAILLAGALTAMEGATNGWISKSSHSLFFAMASAFALSGVLLAVAALFLPWRPNWTELRTLPWYAWLGGVYVVVTITLAAWATPKLGAGPALVAALIAQTALGLVLDHFGLLGLERSPITWMKAAGLVVMIAGATMVGVK